MPLRIVTPPVLEPVTTAEAKSQLRLETGLDDSYVASLIKSARQHVERTAWRGIMQQTLELILPGFRGEDRLELTPEWSSRSADEVTWLSEAVYSSYSSYRFRPYLELAGGHLATAPAIAVTYLDPAGAPTVWPSAQYVIENQANDRQLGRLWLNHAGGFQWPTTLARFDAVKVQYVVGWATAAEVPEALRHAILLLVAQLYENRTPEVTGTIVSQIGLSYDALLEPYRFVRL
jgi:hypothetical protein